MRKTRRQRGGQDPRLSVSDLRKIYERKSVNRQSANRQSVNAQPVPEQLVNAQPVNAQPVVTTSVNNYLGMIPPSFRVTNINGMQVFVTDQDNKCHLIDFSLGLPPKITDCVVTQPELQLPQSQNPRNRASRLSLKQTGGHSDHNSAIKQALGDQMDALDKLQPVLLRKISEAVQEVKNNLEERLNSFK
jgi:hypothetical protein